MEKKKIKGGLKIKGMRNASYERRKDLEKPGNESEKYAPLHTESSGKKISNSHVQPGDLSGSSKSE
jgi:hypothetical protein